MDILLPQLQSFLQDNVDFVRASDVCLVPNPNLIPEGAGFPMIGIKDGNVAISELMGDVLEKTLPIEIYLYDRLDRSGNNILGLHQMCRQVAVLLRGHGFPGHVDTPTPTTEMQVTLLSTNKGLVIRKGLKFQYEREE